MRCINFPVCLSGQSAARLRAADLEPLKLNRYKLSQINLKSIRLVVEQHNFFGSLSIAEDLSADRRLGKEMCRRGFRAALSQAMAARWAWGTATGRWPEQLKIKVGLASELCVRNPATKWALICRLMRFLFFKNAYNLRDRFGADLHNILLNFPHGCSHKVGRLAQDGNTQITGVEFNQRLQFGHSINLGCSLNHLLLQFWQKRRDFFCHQIANTFFLI